MEDFVLRFGPEGVWLNQAVIVRMEKVDGFRVNVTGLDALLTEN